MNKGIFVKRLFCWHALMMAVAILAGGCATNAEHGVFNYQIEPSLYVNRPMWPTPEDGEVPRYMYAGQLLGEENFRKPEEKREGLKAFLHWLGGLFDSEAVPVVLQRPQSGVVDSTGRFWVTDNSRQAVFVFDQEAGQLNLFEYADSATHFVAPTGIALGVADDIYVADSELGLVVRLNRKGESVGVIGKGELRRPVGLAFDMATRHLYVADTYAHDIKVFDADGRLLRTLGRRGVQPGEFNYPTFLAFANGELYVSDTMNARIQVLDAETGESKQVIGEMGMNMGNLVRPKGIAVDPEGNIYVVESYYDYLLVFNKHGEFLMPIGGTGQDVGKFYLPSGVWSDAMNRIFVADVFNGRIVLFQFLGGEG